MIYNFIINNCKNFKYPLYNKLKFTLNLSIEGNEICNQKFMNITPGQEGNDQHLSVMLDVQMQNHDD